jgi:hypothetical protein
MSDGIYWGGDLDLGLTVGKRRLILREEQRFLHMHVLGLSGKGKTSFLTSLIRQDILNGQGVCVIDPHGALYRDLVEWCAAYGLHRQRKIRLFNPSEERWRVGFNPIHRQRGHELYGVVDTALRAIATCWSDEDLSRTPRLQRGLRALLYALAANGLTLCEAEHVLFGERNCPIREYLTTNLADAVFSKAWKEFNGMSEREFREQFESTLNRLFMFLDAPLVRTILGQRERTLDLRRAMDDGEVILVNLAPADHRGFSGEDARLLGNLLVNALFTTALSRQPNASRPFYLFVDEAYDFLSKDVEKILDQARKFGLHLVLSHQRLAQLRDKSEAIASGVIAGAQTKIVFGLGRADADEMGYELFASSFDLEKPKEGMIRPIAVGQELVRLRNSSRSRGSSTVVGRTSGTTETETESDTYSEVDSSGVSDGWGNGTTSGETQSISFVESDGQMTLWGSFEGLQSISSSEGEFEGTSGGVTSSQSSIRGGGTSYGLSTSESETTAEGTNESETAGESDGYRTVYKNLPTAIYSLEELKHLASNELFELERRQAYVRVPDHEPIKIVADLVEPGCPDPECLDAWITERHMTDEYTVSAGLIEQELAERPALLARLALQARCDDQVKKLADEPELDDGDLSS